MAYGLGGTATPTPVDSPSPDTSFAPAASGPSAQSSQDAQLGSTIGTVAGAYFGPLGSAIGGQLGGAVGSAIGGGSPAPAPPVKSSFDSSGFVVNFGSGTISGSGSGGSGTSGSSPFGKLSGQLPLIIMGIAGLLGIVLWKKL
jgi:hypothetical protein